MSNLQKFSEVGWQGSGMRLVGHRGASATFPENTLPAFRQALEMGAGFEMDLQLLGTGEVIVFHDNTLRRTANLKWTSTSQDLRDCPIASLSLADVRSYEVGSWLGPEFAGEDPPLLSDTLSLLERYAHLPSAHTFAELKSHTGGTDDPAAWMEAGYDEALPPAAAGVAIEHGMTPEQVRERASITQD